MGNEPGDSQAPHLLWLICGVQLANEAMQTSSLLCPAGKNAGSGLRLELHLTLDYFFSFYLPSSQPVSNWFSVKVPESKKYSLSGCRTPGVRLARSLGTKNGKGRFGSPGTCVSDGGIFAPIKVQALNSISFALTSPLFGPRSAALGWFSTLKGARLVPSFAQLLPLAAWKRKKKKKKSPVLHLFIFLLRISAVQRVYSKEINVTLLRKGKSKHRRESHQSPGWEIESLCASDSNVWEGEKSKTAWWFFKAYLFSDVCFMTVLKVWGGGMTLVSSWHKEPALSF